MKQKYQIIRDDENKKLVIREFARVFPWLAGRRMLRRIHCWTDRRMNKERRCC